MREAKGRATADRIAHLKKFEMASAAEALLVGTNWIPEPLRTPGQSLDGGVGAETVEGEVQSTAHGGEPAMDQSGSDDEESEPSAGIAAE